VSTWDFKNLRLLAAFEAIMTRGSIVSAADALGVTQSAVSKQLAQLRDWLDDELFVRTSDGMQPTPRAMAIRDRVESILEQAGSLVSEGRVQPSEFTGQFVLSATDEVIHRLAPVLVEQLAAEAPALRLVTLPLTRDYLVRQLESGQANLVVAVNWHAPELLMQKKLGSDHFMCVMHEEHPLANVELTLERYAAATHVLVAPLGHEKGVVDVELDRRGLKRWVCASVWAFGMVDEALLGRSRISTLPSRVAHRLVQSGPFVAKDVPLKLPQTDYFALWHPRFSNEPRLRWMLGVIADVFESS